MAKPLIGAQLFSVRDKTQTIEDFDNCLGALNQMGYTSCQISGQGRDLKWSDMRNILDKYQMVCACTHISFDDMLNNFDKVIENHKTIGTKYIGVGSMPEKYRVSEEGFYAFAKDAGDMAKRLSDKGFTFIYHNHAFEFKRFEESKKNGLEILLANTPKEFQFELDVFWVQAGGGDPLDWISRVEGRMDVAHIKEMNGGGNPHVMAPIGYGNLNWPVILSALEDIGVVHAEVEQDNAVETNSLEEMRKSINYLKTIGARLS